MNEEPNVTQASQTNPPTSVPTNNPGEQEALDAASSNAAGGSPKKSKKKAVIIILVILLLLGGGAAAWYFLIRKAPSNTPAATVQPAQQETKVLKPSQILYEQTDNGGTTTFSRIPLLGGTATPITSVYDPGILDFHENLVATIGTPSFQQRNDGSNVYLSTDGGQTFNAIYKVEKVGDVTPAVSSAIISNDGKKVVFGVVTKISDGTNTVKEYDIASKTTKDLFTASRPGVYLEAYSPSAQKLFYFTGCFMCDGVSRNQLIMQDLAAKTETQIYSDTTKVGTSLDFNQDLSKAVVVQGVPATMTMGVAAPYTVRELTIATKAFRDIATTNNAQETQGGYTSDYKSIYYSDGNNVYSVDSAGKKVTAFEASQPIYKVLYVGTDYVVTSVGNDEKPSTITFDIKQNKATTVLAENLKAYAFGVSWE